MQRRQGTLKEKLADHYAKRELSFKPPKQSPSIVGVVYAVGMMTTLALEGVLMLVPWYFVDDNGQHSGWFFFGELMVLWLFVGAAGNWWLTYYDVSNRVTKETKDLNFPNLSETPPGWKNCITCMLDVPPRSHHCSLCNHCILKRDHHCFFTGSCVGYHNQRHFFVFCVYAVLASGFAAFIQIAYLNHRVPLFTDAAVFYIPGVAIWQLLTGAASFISVFILLHLYLTIFSFAAAGFFLWWELLIILRGQTSYEGWKQIMVYNQSSVWKNIQSVFGEPLTMLLVFLVPIRVASPEDGVKWKIEAKSEKGH